jgi:chemotaxis protein CheC
MMAPDVVLSDLERDALTELLNIGVSRAAASLRKMVGEHVLLSVPAVEIVDRQAAAALIGERESDDLVAVRQDFSGAFSGRVLLIFPQASSLELVRVVAGEEMPQSEAFDIEQEALAETGNVILNGCMGTMANLLRRPLNMSLPLILRGDGADLFQSKDQVMDSGLVLFLYINFSVRSKNIRGYIAMLLDLPSFTALRLLIGDFIATVMDEDTDLVG